MIFLKMYGPFVSAMGFFLLAARLKIKEKVIFKIRLSYAEAQIPITNRIMGRILLLFLGILFLYYYVIIDIAVFFPTHMKMEVFYDKEGIRQSLSVFSSGELKQLGYAENNDSLSSIYYEALDARLKEILTYSGFFSLSDGVVHSSGDTFFEVTKISGFQRYKITEARGELLHILDRPNKPSLTFKSFFDLLPTSQDYMQPTAHDLFISRSYILKPRFKQTIAELNRSDAVLFDHTLVGVTKVFFLPLPHFSNTVYFFQYKERVVVPVGYAVYQY